MIFKVTTYSIKDCGYYKLGEKKPQVCTSGTVLFQDLYTWVKKLKTLQETRIHNSLKSSHPVYIYDLQKKEDDYVLTTWNERLQSQGNAVLGVDKTNPPQGQARVVSRKFSAEMIPGIPTYFFVMAESNIIATICPESAFINGHMELDDYLASYLMRHASFLDHPCEVESEDLVTSTPKKKVVALNEEDGNFFPRFSSVPDTAAAKRQFVREHSSRIRKIVHSMDLSNKTDAEKKAFLTELLNLTGVKAKASAAKTMKLRYAIDVSLDEATVESLIAEWDAKPATWQNVGFVLHGAAKTIWLDGGLKREEFNLSVSAKNGVIPAISLLSELENIRESLL